MSWPTGEPPRREPAINLPSVVLWTMVVLIAIHAARSVISEHLDTEILLLFAFIPTRFDPVSEFAGILPGGVGADFWTFLTYALLHGSWSHLLVNGLWLVAFGSAVARRFGTLRFLALSGAAAVGGAAVHLLFHWGEFVPMIGASAAISGQMAAAIRFVFRPGGPLNPLRFGFTNIYEAPALPLLDSLRQPQVLMFLAVWFGLNIIFGLASGAMPGAGDDQVAWEAHIGGFLAGLLLFRLFDPIPPATPLRQEGRLPHDGSTDRT